MSPAVQNSSPVHVLYRGNSSASLCSWALFSSHLVGTRFRDFSKTMSMTVILSGLECYVNGINGNHTQ